MAGRLEEKNISSYSKLPAARWRIMFCTALLLAILWLMISVRIPPFPDFDIIFPFASAAAKGRLLFIIYVTGFASMWLVYFTSSWYERLNVRTLRMLLRHTALNWSDPMENVRQFLLEPPPSPASAQAIIDSDKEMERLDDQFKAKATASLQNLGILTAVAALGLSQAAQLAAGVQQPADLAAWKRWTLDIAVVAIITAYVMFIVSADALDTMFNRFRGTYERHVLVHYFYGITRNRRYLGFVFLLFAAAVLVAFFEPWLGTVSLGVIISVGYPLWFPDPRPARQAYEKKLRTFGALVIIGLPLVLWAALT